eukprot:CAMPEP_0172454856 /NCGR_PEP_ID=MMETSP1065-20121228/11728_1 /TAXON_ID=265537 /ORGANISM="Amphiprora paludosa, Strain CCMP125" /LENGTH=123 /DNA_ID=CAMNT_0013207261 /DNA_START=42 /DNA_END=413 /DNA_ORIENTATION=-
MRNSSNINSSPTAKKTAPIKARRAPRSIILRRSTAVMRHPPAIIAKQEEDILYMDFSEDKSLSKSSSSAFQRVLPSSRRFSPCTRRPCPPVEEEDFVLVFPKGGNFSTPRPLQPRFSSFDFDE